MLFVFLWWRSRSNSSATTSSSGIPVGMPVAGGSAGSSGSGGAGFSALTQALQQASAQRQKLAQAQQTALSEVEMQNQTQAMGQMSTFQKALAAVQTQISQQTQAMMQEVAAIQAGRSNSTLSSLSSNVSVPSRTSGLTVEQWAQNLDIPLSWAQQYLQSGGSMSSPLTSLNRWLDQQGYRNPSTGALNTISPAVVQQGTSGGTQTYVPGSAPATASHPAGPGGVWKGSTGSQIRNLFRSTYGSNWRTIWQQQHAAQVAKYGQ